MEHHHGLEVSGLFSKMMIFTPIYRDDMYDINFKSNSQFCNIFI